MANQNKSGNKNTVKEVRKPFLKGDITDENTIRKSLTFFGTLFVVFFVSFIACVSANFGNIILRVLLNLAVVVLALMVFFNNGSRHGADAVARGEIIYQKKEKGQAFSDSERKICFHPGKGYLNGFLGTLPFLIAAVILSLFTRVQMTGSGTLPSWMQTYVQRDDIGNALIHYIQPEGMNFVDYLRAFIRICIIPFINIIGYSDKTSLYLLEKICPVILLLPAASYGTGYLAGRNIRTKIHTAISENDRRRIRKDRKRRKTRENAPRRHETEQLN